MPLPRRVESYVNLVIWKQPFIYWNVLKMTYGKELAVLPLQGFGAYVV